MRTPIPGGLLVAVEGIDGAGKTTVSTILAQWCGERGLACTFSKEPTSLHYGQLLRESAKTGRLSAEEEVELFLKDRIDHVQRSIRPTLDAGGIVILDRYYWSTAAYQGARGIDFQKIIAENERHAPVPDLILLLDLEARDGVQRIHRRGDTPNDFEEIGALDQARQIFLALHSGDRPSVRIDANRDLRAVCSEALRTFKQAARRKIAQSPAPVETALALFA